MSQLKGWQRKLLIINSLCHFTFPRVKEEKSLESDMKGVLLTLELSIDIEACGEIFKEKNVTLYFTKLE